MIFFSIYNKFKLKRWFKYSAGKRQRILEKVEKKQAKKQHREPLDVIIKTDPNWSCLGMFEAKGNHKVLYLNYRLVSESKLRFHALETIFHEGRHAYQHNVINTSSHLSWRARHWRDNYKGYFSSKEDSTIYGFQPIERDAQKYAIKQLRRQGFRFHGEEDYAITIESMKNRYENAEKNARKQHGLFYKFKIKRKINKKAKKH